jgi:hypothetical protein
MIDRSKYFPSRTHGRCPVRNCLNDATQGHHILYDYHEGGPVVAYLCSEHHYWITRENSHQARRQHHELSEKQRHRNWYMLIKGEMKRPRNTHRDRDWKERGDFEFGKDQARLEAD